MVCHLYKIYTNTLNAYMAQWPPNFYKAFPLGPLETLIHQSPWTFTPSTFSLYLSFSSCAEGHRAPSISHGPSCCHQSLPKHTAQFPVRRVSPQGVASQTERSSVKRFER